MNISTVKRVLKSAEKLSSDYSIGFSRLASLPNKTRKTLNLASVMSEQKNPHEQQKSFFESLTDVEFKNWLINN